VIAGTLLLLALLATAGDDVVTLTNGDRITGKILSKGKRTLRLQTPHGLLTIGLDKIERFRRADGTEEVLKPPPPPPPTLPPPPPPATLKLVFGISGKTFWQAWDQASAPADPTLRLELRIDDVPIAAWVDSKVDEGEIPKAVVNSFSFTPDSLKVTPASGVKGLPPDLRPGRIQLTLDVPAELAGPRALRLAYQGNAGTAATPEWRDLAVAEVTRDLAVEEPNVFRVEQERGKMEYSKRRMKNVETFQIALKLDTPSDAP
jgi:hypothetical protein